MSMIKASSTHLWGNIYLLFVRFSEYVHNWAKDHNLTPVSMSFGKSGGVSTGENVYAITYWLDLDNNRTMASVEAPDDKLVCIIFYTHELMLNPNLGAKNKS